MALPKIQTPVFELTLPSDDTIIKYRPFTVKEEKILLIAQKSNSNKDQIGAVKQIINNCIIEPDNILVDDLAAFDIEYIFLKLRAKSVGEVVTISIGPKNRDDLPPMKVEINIDEIEPTKNKTKNEPIDLGDGHSIKMKFPTFKMLESVEDTADHTQFLKLFADCIETLYTDEETYEMKDYSIKEREEFLDSMSSKQLQMLQIFFNDLPKIRKEVTYKYVNPDDSNDTYEEEVVIEGIINFLS